MVQRASILLVLAAVTGAAAAAAQDKKPFVEPGTRREPWETAGEPQGARPDDKYADIRIEVDKKGRPTRCQVIRSNVRDALTKLQMCQSYMEDWHIQPLIQDGKAVPQVVMRHTILHGIRHPR
jgi:hypothetical protein